MRLPFVASLLVTACIAVHGQGAASGSLNSWPQEPDGFKGVKFGSTEAQAKLSDMPDIKMVMCSAQTPQQRFCTLSIGAGDFNLTAYFDFVDDKFTKVLGHFPSESYSDVKEMFISKYGKPHNITHTVVQNGMGATFEDESLNWTGKISRVSLMRYGTTVTQGVFAVSLVNAPDPAREEREAAKKKALK